MTNRVRITHDGTGYVRLADLVRSPEFARVKKQVREFFADRATSLQMTTMGSNRTTERANTKQSRGRP